MRIRVLAIEDNFDLAGIVIDYLEATGVVCDHARDGQAGLSLMRADRYDMILLDIMLPRINGRQVCRQLREAGLQTSILMLTTLDTLQDKLDGFDVGADDYLLRPSELSELLVRPQAPSRRRSSQIQRLQVDDLVMDFNSCQVSRGGTPLALSPTARRIFERLMRASSVLATREQLGRSVWGDEPPEGNILNVHTHYLCSIVDKGLATSPIHILHSVGFQLERK